MQLTAPSWESTLLARAAEGLEDVQQENARPTLGDAPHLDAAYERCAAITARHSRTFHLASGMLPAERRRAARALYAFCRITDDIVDQGAGNRCERLEAWRTVALSPDPPFHEPVAVAWADARQRFGIPLPYARQLIDGVARDLEVRRYETFDELTEYCYGVASTVGLMSMYITGFTGEAAVPYAVRLGVALQLTNILRDVSEDLAAGRIYLPLDELRDYDLDERDLRRGEVDERWRSFMAFQVARNRRLYDEALPGIGLLQHDGRFGIAAAAELYRGILDDIDAHDGDVFSRRAFVTKFGKARRLPGIWWRARTATPPGGPRAAAGATRSPRRAIPGTSTDRDERGT